jgi:hypothetical protein
MLSRCKPLQNLDNLREYVNEVLCEHNQLELGAFPITERILVRGGKPCGIYFCLHGPRAVKFSAIWETNQNTILFYGSDGERFHRVQLVEAPRLESVAA